MKKFLLFLFAVPLVFANCEHDHDDDHDHDHGDAEYSYAVTLMQPTNADKHIGDTMHIHVNFSSLNEEPVHHVNVRIYNAVSNVEVYSEPSNAHVHEMDGLYEFHSDFVLSNDNGVVEHTDWILEAKVWGHDGEEGLQTDTVGFHVHP